MNLKWTAGRLAAVGIFCLSVVSAAFAEPDAGDIVFPAGRRHYVRGENFRMWAMLPPHGAQIGRLTIFTDEGLVVTVREQLQASAQSETLSYLIDTQPLSPGRYYAEFVSGDYAARGHFYIEAPRDSRFFIGVESVPDGGVQAERYRSLGMDAAVPDDPAQIDVDALAQAKMAWMRHLKLKPGLSPADDEALTAGKMYTKAAVQALPNSWGFRGIFLEAAPGYAGLQSHVDLIDIFPQADRPLAARALVLVACNSIKPAAEALDKLNPSPEKRLLMNCLKRILREGKPKPDLEPDVRALLQQEEPPENLPKRVREFLKANDLPIHICTIENPFADEHIVQAFEKRFGLRIPPWWQGNENWEDWLRYSKFRSRLWPDALEQWTAAARDVVSDLSVVMPAVAGPEDFVGDAAGVRLIRAGDSVLGAAETLLTAALNHRANQKATLWVQPVAADAVALRRRVLTGLAAGAKGVVYPENVARSLEDFHLSAEAAELNGFLEKYGNLAATLERKQSKMAVLFSENSYWYDLGENPLVNGSRSAYFERVLTAWTACAFAGYVPDVVSEPADAADLAGYQVLLAPGILKLDERTADMLKNFKGTVVVDESAEASIEGAAKLPFSFPDHLDLEQIDKTSTEIALRFKGLVRREIFDSADKCIVTEFENGSAARYFWLINKSATESAEANVRLPVENPAVYDVRAQTLLRQEVNAAENAILLPGELEPGECRLMAALPQAIDHVALTEPHVEQNKLIIEAAIQNAEGKTIDATVPASVVVLDNGGAERFRLTINFERGKLRVQVPPAVNEDFGDWFVRVTELFSQKSQATAFSLEPLEPMNVVSAVGDVEPFDRPECERLLKAARVLTLVCGSGESRKAADSLAKALQRLAIDCTVVPQGKVADGAGIAGDAIVLGNAEDNELARHLQSQFLVPLGKLENLGRGRALVFWTASAFQPATESISIWANDAEGYEQGVNALLEMCGSRRYENSRELRVEALRQNSPRSTIDDVLPPVFEFDAGSPITSLAVPPTGRFILAGCLDGSVSAITRRGEEAWHTDGASPVREVLLPRKSNDSLVCTDRRVAELSIVSTQNWEFALDDETESITAACYAAESGRSYIGTSAGRIIAIDKTGGKLWETRSGGRVTALAAAGEGVACTDVAGIRLLNSEGALVWSDKQIRLTAVGIDPDGNVLSGDAFGNIDCRKLSDGLILWHREAGSAVIQFQNTTVGNTLAATEGGSVLNLAGENGVQFFESGTHVLRSASPGMEGWLAAGSLAGQVIVLANNRLCAFVVPEARISAIAVAPEAELVVVGDWAGTVRAYHMSTWKEIEFK